MEPAVWGDPHHHKDIQVNSVFLVSQMLRVGFVALNPERKGRKFGHVGSASQKAKREAGARLGRTGWELPITPGVDTLGESASERNSKCNP